MTEYTYKADASIDQWGTIKASAPRLEPARKAVQVIELNGGLVALMSDGSVLTRQPLDEQWLDITPSGSAEAAGRGP